MDVNVSNNAQFATKLEKLWDNPSVRILKKWNLVIWNPFSTFKLSWVKTIIVEEWDLVINSDTEYMWSDDSFAFIVKNWNIYVSKSVTKISWVFMALGEGKWKIMSSDWATSKQLSVIWSLYWDTSPIVASRTFIRWSTAYTSLSTWITINYSNRALKNPPPMLTYFVKQYNEKKVAK